jgi:hypothetical protein
MSCFPASMREPPTNPAERIAAACTAGLPFTQSWTSEPAPSTAVEVCAEGMPLPPPSGRRLTSASPSAALLPWAEANITT